MRHDICFFNLLHGFPFNLLQDVCTAARFRFNHDVSIDCFIVAINCVVVTFILAIFTFVVVVVVVVVVSCIIAIKYTACTMKTYRKRKLSVITSIAGVPNIIIVQIMYVSLKFINLIPVDRLVQI